jgi:hypothetical protein
LMLRGSPLRDSLAAGVRPVGPAAGGAAFAAAADLALGCSYSFLRGGLLRLFHLLLGLRAPVGSDRTIRGGYGSTSTTIMPQQLS